MIIVCLSKVTQKHYLVSQSKEYLTFVKLDFNL